MTWAGLEGGASALTAADRSCPEAGALGPPAPRRVGSVITLGCDPLWQDLGFPMVILALLLCQGLQRAAAAGDLPGLTAAVSHSYVCMNKAPMQMWLTGAGGVDLGWPTCFDPDLEDWLRQVSLPTWGKSL